LHRSSSRRIVRRARAEGLTSRPPNVTAHMAIRVPVRRRLDPATFHLPVDKMRTGYYSDTYFNRVREILERDGHHPRVLMQVFNKKDAVLCGIDEAIAILRLCSGHSLADGSWKDGWPQLDVRALYDGDRVAPYEVVLTIEGDYGLFCHLETDYLGVLARRTKVATNTSAVVAAANGKNVLFFPARFDHHLVQTGDGYAAYVSGALGVSTDAQAEWWGSRGIGTVPHGLIAAYGGDTVLAVQKFADHADPSVNVIALVDFDNDCVATSVALAKKLGRRLWGVRIDTAETLVDKSLWNDMGTFNPTGVNPALVLNVRGALDAAGYPWVKIIVSGGFTVEKIREFESRQIPVDAYAVGSALFEGKFDFTADIALVNRGGQMVECHKVGRPYNPNPRLERVM
jgi:nicotinate phosphoribosyltransferase